MATPKLSKAAQHVLLDIAERVLSLETLERRGRDHLDFHDLHVWTLRRALEEAYLAGMVDHHRRR